MRLLSPRKLTYLGRFTETAGGTNRLPLVIGMSPTPTTSEVRGLLALTHGRSTFTHLNTS